MAANVMVVSVVKKAAWSLMILMNVILANKKGDEYDNIT
jgi:hypothetical protein